MSLFKSSALILKVHKNHTKHLLIDVFSKEYGKITLKAASHAQEKKLDIGYLINFEIRVKKEHDIHEIKNIKIQKVFEYEEKNYEILIAFLEILKSISVYAPWGVPIEEIFFGSEILLKNQLKISQEILYIFHLKIFFILWMLPTSHHSQEIQKILKFISTQNFHTLGKLTWFTREIWSQLSQIIQSIQNNHE